MTRTRLLDWPADTKSLNEWRNLSLSHVRSGSTGWNLNEDNTNVSHIWTRSTIAFSHYEGFNPGETTLSHDSNCISLDSNYHLPRQVSGFQKECFGVTVSDPFNAYYCLLVQCHVLLLRQRAAHIHFNTPWINFNFSSGNPNGLSHYSARFINFWESNLKNISLKKPSILGATMSLGELGYDDRLA